MSCNHPRLQFNSGDYYLTCRDCGARWARIGYITDQPEYGVDAKGFHIGARPDLANAGFTETDPMRHRQS